MISASFTVQNFDKDVSLLGSGQTCRSMFYVSSGITRSYVIDENGRDFTTCFHFNKPSSNVKSLFLTDFSSVIRKEASQLHFQTLTEVLAVELPISAISGLYERGSKWEKLGRRLAEEAYYHTQKGRCHCSWKQRNSVILSYVNRCHIWLIVFQNITWRPIWVLRLNHSAELKVEAKLPYGNALFFCRYYLAPKQIGEQSCLYVNSFSTSKTLTVIFTNIRAISWFI